MQRLGRTRRTAGAAEVTGGRGGVGAGRGRGGAGFMPPAVSRATASQHNAVSL